MNDKIQGELYWVRHKHNLWAVWEPAWLADHREDGWLCSVIGCSFANKQDYEIGPRLYVPEALAKHKEYPK